MKRLLFILLISALCGCSTTRKVSLSTETQIVNKTEADVVQKRDKDSTTRTDSSVQVSETSAGSREVVIREFDTDKQTDPITGRPPLKSETTIREYREAARQTQAVRQDETNIHESDSVADKSKYNISLKNKAAESVKTKKSVPWWVWIVVGGVVVLIFIMCRKWKFLRTFK